MIFEDCKNCTKNKFNKYDTVINFVENKIGCIEKYVGCNWSQNLKLQQKNQYKKYIVIQFILFLQLKAISKNGEKLILFIDGVGKINAF